MTCVDECNAAPRSIAIPSPSASSRRVELHNVSDCLGAQHERVTREVLARRIASLNGWTFGSSACPNANRAKYLLPNDTIIGISARRSLGVSSEQEFLGGAVSAAFMATKAITHGLVDNASYAPRSWSHEFCRAVDRVVLRGYTCFTAEDARIGSRRLLQRAPFRFKSVNATGGRGQRLVKSASEMESIIEAIDDEKLMKEGLVLEENLVGVVTTYSVGQVRLADSLIAYVGVQHLVPNNEGRLAYGGSDLTVIRGDFANLLTLKNLTPAAREAVNQVRVYDAAASHHLPGLLASRRNYDVISGTTSYGARCSGVLEQSWRIGGATPAEIAALEGFRDTPQAIRIQASVVEKYGNVKHVPRNAVIYFQGIDADVGPITKYTCSKIDECGGKSNSG